MAKVIYGVMDDTLLVHLDGTVHKIPYGSNVLVPNKVIEFLDHDRGPMGSVRNHFKTRYYNNEQSYIVLSHRTRCA